jgi:hypothetical protein
LRAAERHGAQNFQPIAPTSTNQIDQIELTLFVEKPLFVLWPPGTCRQVLDSRRAARSREVPPHPCDRTCWPGGHGQAVEVKRPAGKDVKEDLRRAVGRNRLPAEDGADSSMIKVVSRAQGVATKEVTVPLRPSPGGAQAAMTKAMKT